MAALLLTAIPIKTEAGWVVPTSALSADGLFMAIIIGLLTPEVARLFHRPKAAATEGPEARIPPAVKDAFGSYLPMLLLATVIWLLRDALGIDLQASLSNALEPLEKLGDTLACVLLVNLVMHLLTVCGIHGISVINAVFFALWQKFLLENTQAHEIGAALPHVTAYPFFQWFIWMGGTGITLPLVFFLLRSKSAHARYVGRISLVPSIFNINEPVLFGLPIVANPVLAVPFIVCPLLCGSIAFLAMQYHLVARPFIEVPWVLPCIVGGPLATQDWRAAVLILLNLALTAVIWWPFYRIFEAELLMRESAPAETVS
jgi:PTS system cellobiose-specific IIC component